MTRIAEHRGSHWHAPRWFTHFVNVLKYEETLWFVLAVLWLAVIAAMIISN